MNEQNREIMKNIEARLDAGLPIAGLGIGSRLAWAYANPVAALAAALETQAVNFELESAKALDQELAEVVATGSTLTHRQDILWKNLKEKIKSEDA